jgi:hypothetical protein
MNTDRREVLFRIFPACALMCRGAAAQPGAAKHKFSEKSEMTYEQVYKFAYGGAIPLMRNLAEEVGKARFEEMLKRAASKAAVEETKQWAAKLPKNDLAAFLTPLKSPDPLWQHALTWQMVEESEKVGEIKVTECLWAKTFRDAGAGDIGYALMCHGDFAAAPAFNPKMKMTRTKTLMQGHDCCNHRWTLAA